MKPQIFAYYLPQYHPFPENDEWWGKGFTEWTNVGKAKPLFPGHYQPHVPADLGYYDLRVPEVRAAQAEMAKKYGIDAFCYYHYWFGNGKQLMQMPINEVIKSGEPDFPFFLCWANHSWQNKNWNSSAQKMESKLLVEQKYPGIEDVYLQFNTILPILKDKRYYKIDGRLAYSFYRPQNIPYLKEYCETFNQLAKSNGLPEFYFMGEAFSEEELSLSGFEYLDAIFLNTFNSAFGSHKMQIIKNILSKIFKFPAKVISYKHAINYLLCEKHKEDKIYPVIRPNWDHSPRLGHNSTIIHNSSPKLWRKLLQNTFETIKDKPQTDQIIMIKSWNEWAEGNHLEPDLKWGLGYLEAIKETLVEYEKR